LEKDSQIGRTTAVIISKMVAQWLNKMLNSVRATSFVLPIKN